MRLLGPALSAEEEQDRARERLRREQKEQIFVELRDPFLVAVEASTDPTAQAQQDASRDPSPSSSPSSTKVGPRQLRRRQFFRRVRARVCRRLSPRNASSPTTATDRYVQHSSAGEAPPSRFSFINNKSNNNGHNGDGLAAPSPKRGCGSSFDSSYLTMATSSYPSAPHGAPPPPGGGGQYPGGPPPPHANGHHGPPPPGVHGGPGGPPAPHQPPDSYFTETRKGEVNELRQLLRNFAVERDQLRKREIIKKVIAYMTLGIDVSRLFSEMMLAIETRDLVIKKMVYLFLCNYASTNPDLAQMCTNTLQKDCGNDDPMVRGLALRALCSLNLPQMVEYISEPLRKSLTDHHAYVRKTGVMGILKLYNLDRDAFDRCNFIDILYDMLRDSDAQVVSNSILVLDEIMAKTEDGGMAINRAIMLHLLNRIHEFSEFGVVAVLNLVPRYRPANEDEMYQIMNLLDPVFKTSNGAAVLATMRAFLSLADQTGNEEMHRQIVNRIKAPLLTLGTGGGSELFYCILKHVDVLINLAPGVFDDEYRQFYVRYNEPTHNKYLKVTILPKLVSPFNASDIIAELAEYVCDIDPHTSKLAVRSIARIACSDRGGEGCAETIAHRLVEFLDLDVEHVSAEAAGALKDVVRKHPELGPIVAPPLPRALRFISEKNEPAGKASVVWLLGELGDRVSEAPYALEKLINIYHDIRDPGVKIALLTATMKLFFKRPPEVRAMLGRLLAAATDDVSSQDLHDRALLYHRLLRAGPKTAELVVCGSSQVIPIDRPFAEETKNEFFVELMKEFNTLSIVYGQTSENFIAEEFQVKFKLMEADTQTGGGGLAGAAAGGGGGGSADSGDGGMGAVTDQMGQASISAGGGEAVAAAPAPPPPADDGGIDLLGFGDDAPAAPAPAPAPASATTPLDLDPSATVTGDAYQSAWGAQAEPTLETSIVLRSRPAGVAEVESSLAASGVLTMASGELPDELKFFLYARERPGVGDGRTFLLQAILTKADGRLAVTVKTDAPGGDTSAGRDRAEAILEAMRGALAAYL